jgi:hypothetical protein
VTVNLTSSNQGIVCTAQDIVDAALQEINITAQGEKSNYEDSAWGLQKLQRELDQMNAREEIIFSHAFTLFTLIGNHGPHTIGPGGDFNIPTRPVKIPSATFVLGGSSGNPVDSPIKMKDADWWAANPVKSLLSSITTHLYYDPASPLGNLNFWPICTVANPVRLEMWNSLAQALSLNSVLGFPQGYWDAIVYDLAVRLCPSFEKGVPPDLREQWNRAMRIIEANNDEPPRIDTDSGMPNSRKGGRPDWNFLTGMRE